MVLPAWPTPATIGDHPRDVGVGGEVVRRPIGCHSGWSAPRRPGPSAKPERRQAKAATATAPAPVGRAGHEPPARDGLALEGARDPAVGGVLALGRLLVRVSHGRARTLSTEIYAAGGRPGASARGARPRQPRARPSAAARRRAGAGGGLGGLMRVVGRPRRPRRAGRPDGLGALGVALGVACAAAR